MKTLRTQDPAEAADVIRNGRLVAFPTETVYGLGADATDERAVRRVFEAKSRPPDNPLIIHLAEGTPLSQVADDVSSQAQALRDRFVPGPLTLILPRNSRIPAVASAGLPTVGVRIPAHPLAQTFLQACRVPVAAPSANRSGRPSPTTWQNVLADLDGRIDCILQGEATNIGLESTVVDCTTRPPTLLRPGAVTLEALRDVLPEVHVARSAADAPSPSPGTRHRHYAPDARIHLVDHPPAQPPDVPATYIGLTAPAEPETFALVKVCASTDEYAQHLFDFLRQSDEVGAGTIYCQRVMPEHLGRALMDRLERAAGER